MMMNRLIFNLVTCKIVVVAIVLLTSPLSFALVEPVSVTVVAIHYGGNVQYNYRVTNNTRARSIVSLSVGNRGVQPPDPMYPTNEQPELYIYPAGSYWGAPIASGDNRGESPRLGGIFSSPPGWEGHILLYAETDNFSIDWGRATQADPGILAGQAFNFGVTVPLNDDPRSPYSMSDPAYLNGHFTVRFAHSDATDEGPEFWQYTGGIISLDTEPPALMVTLNPSILHPNEKLVPITATIAVKDGYDPQPEIKLESITTNEVWEADDIQGAQLSMDDRAFSLKAERAGKNKNGRIYTVTYSATDASGNKSIATATVTVPHDQDDSEKDDPEKDKRRNKDKRE